MRILQLCKKFPWPLKDGESIAVYHLASAYRRLGCQIDLLSMNTSKHWVNPDDLPADFDHYGAVRTVDIYNHIRPGDALRNLLFSKKSYHISRFESAAFAEALRQMLETGHYDVVQLESVYMAPYLPVIRRYSNARIALRAHNVEHEIWFQVARNSGRLKGAYLRLITPRLRDYELSRLNEYDIVVAISPNDAARFVELGLKKPAIVAPVGIDIRRYQADYACFEAYPALSFIGSLDWIPNQEGLWWFIHKVWLPLLQPRFPRLQFHIAGRNAPERLQRLKAPGVVFHGETADAAAFLNTCPIMVVPLLSGSGIRIKIIEAMALGRVVVSTTTGIEGIPARHGQEAWIADTPEDFAEAIGRCIQEREGLKGMGEAARRLCESHFDDLRIADAVLDAYRALPAPRDNAICPTT